MIKKLLLAICATIPLLVALPAYADAPALQLSPLLYVDNIQPHQVKSGSVVISNPGDSEVQIVSSVMGFRQTGQNGDLDFYSNPDYSQGITVDLTNFTLAPKAAMHVSFTVDGSKLPLGGVYAAIFFQTVPPPQSPNSSYVSQSANIGTLLELTNGSGFKYQGKFASVSLPFFQFGPGIKGRLTFSNTSKSVGFDPNLLAQVTSWGKKQTIASGLVMAGTSRQFSVSRPGSYFGLVPVTVTDSVTGASATRWVFALTGTWPYFLLVAVLALLGVLVAWAVRLLKRRPEAPKANIAMDGLSSKSKSAK